MVRIFVSYRRTDSDIAGRISDRLVDEFGNDAVFFDVDNIPIGRDFRSVIDDAISESSCVLAIIGPGWIRASEDGSPDGGDLQSEVDYVRLEVKSALVQSKPLIPVLVGGVVMPEPRSLPEELRPIAFLNAASIRSGHGFRQDFDALFAAITALHPNESLGPQSPPNDDVGSGRGNVVDFGTRELIEFPQQIENRSIGRYQLRRFVAAGGGGAVYEAVDKNLHQTVCLKIAYPMDLAASDLKRIVSKGVRGLVQMKHKGVVPIFDFDDFHLVDGKSSFFLVMELSHGTNLAGWTARRSNDLDGLRMRLECARQITATLQDAHEFRYIGDDGVETVGVLHGDIKPNNIFVEPDGTPRLLDFLLVDVQRLQSPTVRARFETNDHHTDAFGTPTYMAAEQERQGVITSRTDIFSWGQTLIDLFVMQSREAFRAKIAYMQAESDTAKEIAASIQSPGSHFVWGCKDRGDLEQELIQLIALCTAPRPENRPGTMREVLRQLDAIIEKVQGKHRRDSDSTGSPPKGSGQTQSPFNRLAGIARLWLGRGAGQSATPASGDGSARRPSMELPDPLPVSAGSVFCIHCGAGSKSESYEYVCDSCGAENEELTCIVHHDCGHWTPMLGRFCRDCGRPMQDDS